MAHDQFWPVRSGPELQSAFWKKASLLPWTSCVTGCKAPGCGSRSETLGAKLSEQEAPTQGRTSVPCTCPSTPWSRQSWWHLPPVPCGSCAQALLHIGRCAGHILITPFPAFGAARCPVSLVSQGHSLVIMPSLLTEVALCLSICLPI